MRCWTTQSSPDALDEVAMARKRAGVAAGAFESLAGAVAGVLLSLR